MFNIPDGAVPLGFIPSTPEQLYVGRAQYSVRINWAANTHAVEDSLT